MKTVAQENFRLRTSSNHFRAQANRATGP
jgi:hypothetical protein